MRHGNFHKGVCVFLAVLFFLGPGFRTLFVQTVHAQPASINPPRTTISLKPFVEELLNVTTDTNDTDMDGLPDSVEAVIGTDPNNIDSDFDRLEDYWEVENGLDPLDPDSNFDGLPDYYEVKDPNLTDIDGDGIENAWDFDNDGDGVNDGVDLSAFTKTDVNELFHFDIATNGNPSCMTFQIKPKNEDHLKLFARTWDWPDGDHRGSVQDWDNSKDDVKVFPILQLSANDLPDAGDVILNGIVVDGDTAYVPLMPVAEHGNIVAFAGRMLYPTATPTNLSMDAELIWKVVCRNDPNSSVFEENTQLATYKDGFSITGMTVEEDYGTDTGLLYSQDIDQVIAANLLLAYQFLRTPANHIADVQGILNSNNVGVESQLASFAHRDAALVSIANEIIPDALDSLPDDMNLPVISILEDNSASLELSEFQKVSGNSFNVNLTSEPVITAKTLKTSWYNTSDRQAMETDDVMVEILQLGLNEAASYSLMTLMLYWNTGEQFLSGAGIPPTDPGDDFELVPDVVERIVGGGLSELEDLYREAVGLAGLQSYQSVKFLQSKGWSVSIGGKAIPDIAKMGTFGKFKTFVKQCEHIQDSSRFFKKMETVLEGMDKAALFVDAGFAAYSIIAISQMNGLSGIALNNAVMEVVVEYYYNAMLFMIGAIPVVGWLVAIGIELSDVFGDWSQDFIDWIIDGISNVDYTVEPDANIVGLPTVTVDDKDTNGMDTGDRVEYKSRLKGTIHGNESHWDLVTRSSIYPYYKLYGPGGSSTITGSPYNKRVLIDWEYYNIPINTPTVTSDKTAGWRAREYESDVWIEPGKAMPNFPVYVELNAVYELHYAWSWYSFVFWDWGWQHEVDWQGGQSKLGGFTIYFDVLPGTIDDFARWKGINQLDHDGDGLNDTDEDGISNRWLYDSDGDGLNDKFEVDNGLDPTRYDTDADGLIDWFEVQFGTDANNPDTDGDGMPDYLEIAGWIIQLEYQGHTFTTQVYSDPTTPDTDSDGIDDHMEYRSGLNPRSRDTNGDGIGDVANPKEDSTVLQLVNDVDVLHGIQDIDVDAEGFVYVLVRGQIIKFDSDLNWMSGWNTEKDDEELIYHAKSMVIDDKNGLIHVGFEYGWGYTGSVWGPAESGILTFNLADGTLLTPEPWSHEMEYYRYDVIELDVDDDGNVYVLRYGTDSIDQYDPVYHYWHCQQETKRARIDVYDANSVLIDTWGKYDTFHDVSYTSTSGHPVWHFYYASEPNSLNDAQDIALRDDGHAFISEIGGRERFYEWLPGNPSGWNYMGENKTRDDRIADYDISGEYFTALFEFTDPDSGLPVSLNEPAGIAVDKDGYIYIVVDSAYIYKFDQNLVPVATWTMDSWNQPHTYIGLGEVWPPYNYIRELAIDANSNLYTYFSRVSEAGVFGTIEKYSQRAADANDIQDPLADRDGDGLLNDVEMAGWDITFTDANGTQTISVTSDPLLTDTDLDGLTDFQEYDLGTNPRNSDTDNDGLSDYAEWRGFSPQTNPRHFDTDGDGLPDGIEITYGSNPNAADTDGEGLSDVQEFGLGSDPNNADTDGDGLNDASELVHKTCLTSPDSDGDFMFDGQEVDMGTDPNNGDTDNDGLSDGMECSVHNTNPSSSDSDGDGLEDNIEVGLRLNPISSDTDDDGVPDGIELAQGTNPWMADSDHDGIPDNLDDPNNVAPDVSKAHPNKEYLWPPNNKYVPITIEGVTDADGDPIQIVVTGVASDEPSFVGKSGKTQPDAYISEDGTLFIRAQRNGSGNG
ncbi:MAG: NHL repeat-containing protein, partial [Planctomycetota bacterium]